MDTQAFFTEKSGFVLETPFPNESNQYVLDASVSPQRIHSVGLLASGGSRIIDYVRVPESFCKELAQKIRN